MDNHPHNKARAGLCLVCLDKSYVKISPTYESFVQEFIVDGYTPHDERLPSGLCSSCSKKLKSFGQGNFAQTLPRSPDYTPMQSFRLSRGAKCSCFLCSRYRIVGLASSKKLTGKRKRKCPQYEDGAQRSIRGVLCLKCFTDVYPGGRHPCSSKQLETNITRLVPSKTIEKIASTMMKEKEMNKEPLTLATHGCPATFIRRSSAQTNGSQNRSSLSLESVKRAKTATGISDKAMIKVIHAFRSDISVEPGLNAALTEQNSKFKNLFDVFILNLFIIVKAP